MYADEEQAALRNPLLWRGMGMVTAGERRPRGGRPDWALSAASGALREKRGGAPGATRRGSGQGAGGSGRGGGWVGAPAASTSPRGAPGGSGGVRGDPPPRRGCVCVCALRRGDCSLKWVGRWPVPGMFHDV